LAEQGVETLVNLLDPRVRDSAGGLLGDLPLIAICAFAATARQADAETSAPSVGTRESAGRPADGAARVASSVRCG
jgi:hypothetical protein